MFNDFEKIEELLQNKRLEEAERELQALATPGKGETAELLYLQGYLAELQHEWSRCVELYEQVLALEPEQTEALFRLAYVCDLLGEDDRALDLYEQCTSGSPAHVNALMNLAILYEDHGRYEEAVECTNCILDQHPNHTRARLFRKDMEASLTMFYDEDQERIREKRDAVLDTPISDYELSVRSRNCLKQMNIRTVGDLMATSEHQLLAYKNFGETSLNEIKAVLDQAGVRLEPVPGEVKTGLLASPPVSKAITTGDPTVLQRQVSELGLSVRARKCLQRLGLGTVGELAACTEAELLAIKNFGQTSLVEIRRRLEEIGLALRGQH
ncbi:MAG: tetratricopeptide repeat protein [Phycisphaerae bacterium]|nr:tetratricopeptide repeat protein [Phycisphaerae bacterium]